MLTESSNFQGQQLLSQSVSPEADFLGFLLDNAILDALSCQRVESAMRAAAQSLDTVLTELGLLDEIKLAKAYARFLGLDLVAQDCFPSFLPDGFDVFADLLSRAQLLPLEKTETEIVLAMATPLDDTTARAISFCLDRKLIIKVAIASELVQHLKALLNLDMKADFDSFSSFEEQNDLNGDADRLRDVASEAPTIRLLNRIIATAVSGNASDIHLEPFEDHLRVRYRIDGALKVAETLDQKVQLGLVSRIKILARLNIAEQRLPQDGRIKIAVRGRDVDIRVATSPSLYGEGVVLRILDRRDIALDFATLGFDEASVGQIGRILTAPNGIILVTGPTGSGKTTSLYAALTLLNKSDAKIFTVEDPIEYQLRGVNQIHVRPNIGLDFAAVLRSVLRQDPDIIMVGEIRDTETARIAVQAALTGHLVLSTLHTNSAASSITRIRDIGIDNFLIVSSLRAIIAQRLVRKLCLNCKENNKPKNNGCSTCHHTGYQGRTVVYEILEIDEEMKSAILNMATDTQLEALAKSNGMTPLSECGMAKVQNGMTSLEEVRRVVSSVK